VLPEWDRKLDRLKKVSARSMGGITPAIQGVARQLQTRQGVYVPLFDAAKERLKKV